MTNRYNTLHKRYQYNINELKKILQNNNLTTVKADKSKAIVIIDKNILEKKGGNFIQENNTRSNFNVLMLNFYVCASVGTVIK